MGELRGRSALDVDWRVHPGEMLQEALDEREMSQSYLAWATGYTPKHINQICKGHVAISAPVAVALEAELEITAEFWLSVQMHYDLHLAREQAAAPSDERCTSAGGW
jgi:addiction module HigA family antidote